MYRRSNMESEWLILLLRWLGWLWLLAMTIVLQFDCVLSGKGFVRKVGDNRELSKRLRFDKWWLHVFFNICIFACLQFYSITLCNACCEKHKNQIKWHHVNNLMQLTYLFRLWFQVLWLILIVTVLDYLW